MTKDYNDFLHDNLSWISLIFMVINISCCSVEVQDIFLHRILGYSIKYIDQYNLAIFVELFKDI